MWAAMQRAQSSPRLMGAVDRVAKPANPFAPQHHGTKLMKYFYERARAHGPIVYQRGLRVWWVTGAEECEAALRLTELSSDRGELVRIVPPYDRMDPEKVDLMLSMLINRDAPDHTRLRGLVNRVFTPRAMSRLEPAIRDICDELLTELSDLESFDAVEAFCEKVPIYAIGGLLGVPPAEWERLKEISDRLIRLIDPIIGFDPLLMNRDMDELAEMFEREFEERRREPRDDIMTGLVEVSDGGDRLSHDELVAMCMVLLVAGYETTSSLLGNALVLFDGHRDQRAVLLEQPDLIGNAVEEILRFEPPVHSPPDRTVAQDCELHGHQLRQGQFVAPILAAANRDPRRHERPNEFDITRPDPRPLSFGHGAHHCLGAALARLEARIAIPAFLAAFPDYAVAGDGVEWKRSVTVRGPRRLVITTGVGGT